MPNHVSQDLIITGNPETLMEFMEFAEEAEGKHTRLLSANKFIPYPKEFADKDKEAEAIMEECKRTGDWTKYSGFKDGFNSGGYDWCRQNWGTKWGIYDAAIRTQKLTGKEGRIKYVFQSAWSPATKIIHAMSIRYPDLNFDLKYYERGMQFKGHYVVKGGVVTTDEQSKYTGRRGG